MKAKLSEKAEELKMVLSDVVDAMVASIKAEAALRSAGEIVPLSRELMHGIENYLRREYVACASCGEVVDANSIDGGLCGNCDAAPARQ